MHSNLDFWSLSVIASLKTVGMCVICDLSPNLDVVVLKLFKPTIENNMTYR